MNEEESIKRTIVVYSGRFQPMHKGHYGVYNHLVKKFGKDNVYIGTSDKVDPPRSPFNFKEKKKIMTTMFPIPKDKVIFIKNPYNPKEILTKFDEKTTAYVTVVSEKDASRLGGKYFTKYEDNPTQGYTDKGYVYVSPMFGDSISASVVRDTLSKGDSPEAKKFFKSKLYSKFNDSIYNMIIGKLNESLVIEKETIEEWLLKEATRGHVGSADDGPLGFFPNFSVFDRISVKRAQKIGYDVVKMIMTGDIQNYQERPPYPNGPVTAVSFYPAGVIGKMTPNNQVDVYSSSAYSQWYKHITRKASLAGYELVQTQLEKTMQKKIKHMSGLDAQGDRDIASEFEKMMNESITLPVEIGDTLLMGKWKNKKVVVKTIGKDEHGMPTVNGKKVVSFRYGKKGPNIFDNVVELEELAKHGNYFKNLGVLRRDMPQIKSGDLRDYLKWLGEQGISHKGEKIPISKLELTQKDIDPKKVDSLQSAPEKVLSKPIIVSKDGFVLDGHHRIVALYNLKPNFKIPAVRVDTPMIQLLGLTKDYPKVSYKEVNETLTLTEATHKLKINIPANIKKLQKMFKKSGFKLYVVGGAIRDAILGKSPKDYDLATDAKPDEVLKIARDNNLHTTEVGKSFGVVIVDGDEIATFRKDIGKGRRPDSVDYTDIEGDVKRRDLTINALFYDLDREEIVDLVGGIADLKNKNIRTVGKAEERFDEDELRKMRAFRFHSRIGGKMDKDTEAALKNNVSLKGVSGERIRDEFLKSIKSAKSVKKYLETVESYGYLKLILPNLKITKPFIEESDYKVLLSYMLQNNDGLEKKLNKLKYSQEEGRDIEFLVNLKNFKPKDIRVLKNKQDKQIHLTKPQVEKFGKLVGTDLKKFNNFKLKLKGSDIPKDLKKSEIGNWMNDEERKRYLNEMARKDLKQVEKFADSKLSPEDVQFTNHFFDRVNDPRNGKEITPSELIGFFKRLSRHKKEFLDFVKKYKEFTITDKKTKINIPLVTQANKVIAKTVMRKNNWKSHDKVLTFEDQFRPDLAKKPKTWYKLDTKSVLKISDNVIDLVQTAYKKTPDGSFVNNKSDLNSSVFWNAIDVDGSEDADAVIFGRKSPNGIKIQGMGHDGDRKSIDAVLVRLSKVLKQKGYWVEASDALEHVFYKMGVPYISSEKVAQSIFPNSDLKMTGKKGQYTRKLQNGKVIQETIFGNPKTSVKEQISEGISVNQFKGGLLDLQKAVKTETKGMTGRISIEYYQNAMKMGVKEKIIDNKTRLKLNRWNKKNFGLGGMHTKDAIVQGIDIALNSLNENTHIDSIDELYSDIDKMLNRVEEGLFQSNTKMKPHDKIITGAVIEFMKSKLGFNGKITVRKKDNDSLIGDVTLNDNSLNKGKFTLHYNPNQSLTLQIQSMIHELTHVSQISKKQLTPSKDYKEILWKGKPALKVSDYKKLQKNFNEYKKLPWEAEAYSNMTKFYKPFLQSEYWKGLKGQNEIVDQYIDNLTENILQEGGKATGGSPIPAELTMTMYNSVIKDISKTFKLTSGDFKPLGSTGKKKKGDFSGDIDMAIDAGKIGANFNLKFNEVQDFIYKKIKSKFNNVVNSKGFGIISFLYPIPKSDEYGQVDLMLSDNLELTNFMFHSPDFTKNESKYKGLYRNIIFTNIIKYIDTGDVNKYFEDGKDKGEVAEFSKYSLTGKDGLMKQIKSYRGKNGKVKNPKTLKGSNQIITQVPIEIVKFVLGDDATIESVQSFETIYKIMNKSSFRYKKNNKKVIDSFKHAIEHLKLPLPSEI